MAQPPPQGLIQSVLVLSKIILIYYSVGIDKSIRQIRYTTQKNKKVIQRALFSLQNYLLKIAASARRAAEGERGKTRKR